MKNHGDMGRYSMTGRLALKDYREKKYIHNRKAGISDCRLMYGRRIEKCNKYIEWPQDISLYRGCLQEAIALRGC
jgi:hypothetical protein